MVDAGQHESATGLPLAPTTRSMPSASRASRCSSSRESRITSVIVATPTASSSDVQHRGQRPAPRVREREGERRSCGDVSRSSAASGRDGSAKTCGSSGRTRASCEATTSVAPLASACARRSSSVGGRMRVVEIGGRLVGQHQRRPVDDRAGDRRHAAPAPATARADSGAPARPHRPHRAARARGPRRRACRRGIAASRRLSRTSSAPTRCRRCGTRPTRAAAPAVARRAGELREVGAADDDGPRRRGRQPGEDVQQRRLAAARGPGKQPVLTGAGPPPATRSAVVAPYRCSIPVSENIPAQRSRPIATANVASCVISVANSAGVSA